jgi:2-polyprenyl-6-methoxyphenol hydroxylase-like FAD-dependent oxidoreductase
MTHDNNPPFRVVIIGGGISGLSLAAFLRQRTSFHIQLIEKMDLYAPLSAEIDYGIAIAPNGTAVLSELGMVDHARELKGCELDQVRGTDEEREAYLHSY